MNDAAFLAELAETLEVPADRLTDDFPLAGGNWDSMALLVVITAIDKHYGVIVDPAPLWKCKTVGALRRVIDETRLKRSA